MTRTNALGRILYILQENPVGTVLQYPNRLEHVRMKKFALLLALTSGTLCLASVSVSSPANGGSVGTPVQYVATATTTCAKGVAAMGIYSAPGVLAYSTLGSSLNTELTLAPGEYQTEVQEWDNCGGASKTPITIYVSAGGGAGVQVASPANNSNVGDPVQYVANATTGCSKGVAAMGIYTAPGVLAYVTNGASLNTELSLNSGTYNTVVQEWDNCGGFSKTPITITVSGGGGGAFSMLQAGQGWTGYALEPPSYNICTTCVPSGPETTWSMTQNVSSPSRSGHSSEMSIGGQTVYSDVLWNNHLIGNGSSQGMPDNNHTIVPSLYNFTYDVYFYVEDPSVSEALEFDINQFVNGYSFIWGHECRIEGGNEWDIWDNQGQTWHPTGIACNPMANAWNHVTLQVERTSSNQLLFQSITLNGVTSTLNYYEDPTTTSWYGVVINYQQDGNYQQAPYSVWLDDLTFSYSQ